MPNSADSSTPTANEVQQSTAEQQALQALSYLSDEDKKKVLLYIASLYHLEKAKHDQRSLK
jgi:hypothetical protein